MKKIIFISVSLLLMILLSTQITVTQKLAKVEIPRDKTVYVNGINNICRKKCRKEIEKIHNEYVKNWLNMDENGLMNLLDANATIQPNTLKPIIGKENIRAFWFPKDNSKTKINTFITKIINFSVVDNLVITTHHSYLDYTYENVSTLVHSKQKAINLTIYRLQTDKTWKIWKSMWADYDIVRE